MALLVSLAALQKGSVQLYGEISAEELGLDTLDPCVVPSAPIRYDVTAEMMGADVLVQGIVEVPLKCQCVHCLEPFDHVLRLDPWASLLVLQGEDATPVVNDSVDLTPQVREDSLLALPQHPLCKPGCNTLPGSVSETRDKPEDSSGSVPRASSAWSILDTLKLE